MSQDLVVVLGATSAIAESTARLFAAEHAPLVLVGRRKERLAVLADDLRARGAPLAEVQEADLARPRSAQEQLKAWVGERPVMAVLLFYGVLGDQARAEGDALYARDLLTTGFTSAAEWCLAAANLLELQGRGVLIVVGSVAGDRGRQSNYVYGAAKAGLGILVQGLAHRFALRRNGPRAVLIKPGFVDTPMTDHLSTGGPLWSKPEAIARVIHKSARTGGPVQYVPSWWRWIMLIIRLMPSSIFHRGRL
jgi:short-subunit dehydrogenase